MKRIEKHIFLLLAALAAGLSVLCFLLLEQNAPGATDEQYVSAVQQRVKEEMQVSNADLDSVAGLLQRNPKPTFTNLFKLPTQYPYFVFQNKQLVYWSDYRFIPEFAQLTSATTTPKLIDFEQGRYLVSHKRVAVGAELLDVFSLVNIYRYYHSNNAYLQSGYNPNLFALDPQSITDKRQRAYQAIYDNTSAFLFSVEPPKVDAYRNHSTPVNTVILASLAMIFLGMYVMQLMFRLKKQHQYELGFIGLAVYLLLLRAVMLYLGVPFLFIETDLFNPKYYASSVLVPSLGDLLLNALVIAILAFYWVRYYYRSKTYMFLLHRPQWLKLVLSVSCVVISYMVFSLCYIELNNIYEKSQFTLDITLNIHFSFLKVVCLVVFITISCIYFLVIHLLASLFLRYNRINHVGIGLLLIVAGTALGGGIWLVLGGALDPVFLLNGVYFLLIYISQLPKTLYTFRYKTSIYLFLAAFICAVMTSYVVYNQEIRKQLNHEQEFATQLLAENDVFGEFLMSKAQESIQKDAEIGRALQTDTLLVRERIQQRVKSLHLDKYFDKYDIEVFSFRANGRPLDISPNPISFTTLTNRYRKTNYKTEYPGVYFINEVDNQFVKQYVCFVAIRQPSTVSTVSRPLSTSSSDTLGYVVLDLRLRNERPKSVYPELLVDTKFTQNPDTQEYSYAFFSGPALGRSSFGTAQHRLLYSGPGSYNYDRKLELSMLDNPALFSTGVASNQFQHVAQRGQDGRIVVVSSPEYPFRNIFSNFSFLYLLLVMTVILVILGYAINYRFSKFNINYSTRIQILLNLAFFLPLIFVILIILGVISSNYVDNQKNTYISNTRNIATNFLAYLDEHLDTKKRSKASMEEELSKIARDADIDINLFDTKGQLYTSTRPLIYESGYLSKRINPEAYIHIIEDKENQILLDESLGSKQYRTAYAGIKSYDGRLLGVLSIPYFYAQPELDRKIIEVIATSLSIFTALFLFFLILSYFASHMLTKPLRLLTQKIRKTNLELPNDPLPWQSDDEIGLLIREYNRMLLKLEESKLALAQTEKQSAWREMAKQVAHEIKNPLTPMKLTLQHLQRTFPNSKDSSAGANDPARRIILRTFDSLLDQIDNLSDIATSFSEFAKMPLPKKEVFEMTGVFNKTADLYADDKRIILRRQVTDGPVMAMGDRQLTGSMLTNLIINAIQSVPPDRKPVIDLKLYTNSDAVQIEIHDNGAGIPEAIQSKVFLPNFSTKRGGSGLGLALAKRGVEHAGGTIWFETVEGVGTSFFVSLPLAGVPGPLVGESVNY
ncbi:HAMP domain-containing histidine kinase [Spirosoma sp. KCTC 42546]|uniref:sensor histidine kinase n=1 Tax=Spirosoma sp. KCTC 42546 TaxID=2520506 RepID=UPI00115C145F|nr:HAMP domain-containing sensor histidine kinase [Spirosoma sp. KCTC 42546]QDK78833.1 HAMP domain-containing histidine kinase [Spirosoma sp. KCTC 42546]